MREGEGCPPAISSGLGIFLFGGNSSRPVRIGPFGWVLMMGSKQYLPCDVVNYKSPAAYGGIHRFDSFSTSLRRSACRPPLHHPLKPSTSQVFHRLGKGRFWIRAAMNLYLRGNSCALLPLSIDFGKTVEEALKCFNAGTECSPDLNGLKLDSVQALTCPTIEGGGMGAFTCPPSGKVITGL